MNTWDLFIGPINIAPYIVIVGGYILTMVTSGYVVKYFIMGPANDTTTDRKSEDQNGDEQASDEQKSNGQQNRGFNAGAIIGKCENFITLTFILSGEFTGLALIFSAKSIVRIDNIRKNPKYYLGGTLVNLCFSILMGFIIRAVLTHIGYYC